MDSVSKEVSAWAIMQFYTERSVERSLMQLLLYAFYTCTRGETDIVDRCRIVINAMRQSGDDVVSEIG
jgi:hypothetical protein